MALIKCKECAKDVSSEADKCPHCGITLSSVIRCKNCNSANVEKISNASKVGSALMWGVFAVGKMSKTYKCLDCKVSW